MQRKLQSRLLIASGAIGAVIVAILVMMSWFQGPSSRHGARRSIRSVNLRSRITYANEHGTRLARVGRWLPSCFENLDDLSLYLQQKSVKPTMEASDMGLQPTSDQTS